MCTVRWTLPAAALSALLLLMPAPADGAQFRFTRSRGVMPIEILAGGEFERRFGADPEMPRTDEAVIALAQKLFRPHWVREQGDGRPEGPGGGDCGEHQVGLVFAALANPAISDIAREEVDALYAESVPFLPHTYTSGKFKIFYTDHNVNANHNVSLQQVQRAAMYLNNAWYQFVTGGSFREPKHWHWLGEPRVDVRVYDIAGDIVGQTNSGWTHIDLDSPAVVRDLCLVKTISAHELFHRVEYSYGYSSGTANMKWIVEGTATWSQRYAQYSVGDYMGWMNNGLSNPDRNLITARSYDAAHLWVFLQQRASPAGNPIRQVWLNYAGNGRNAKAALNSYTTNRFGPDFAFDSFIAWWHRVNIIKDFSNAANFDYSEDERSVTSCGETYGPLAHVPRRTGTIATDATPAVSFARFVAANGADYYEYALGAGVTHVRVVANGASGRSFTYAFSRSKSNRFLTDLVRTAEDYTYQETFTAGDSDALQIVVVGNTGGNYTLTIGP